MFCVVRYTTSRNIASKNMEPSTQTWLPTAKAAKVLGINAQTLKRAYGHPKTGFLREGTYWKAGPYANSSKGWCIEECRKELTNKGFIFFASVEEAG